MKNFIYWFIKRLFSGAKEVKEEPDFSGEAYTVHGGRKYKNDEIHCFISGNKKWGVMKMDDSGNYEELLPPIYDSTGYQAGKDLIVAVQCENGKYALNGNTYYLFKSDGQLFSTVKDIDYIQFEENGAVLVRKNKKYGVLDDSFQFDVPCEYALLTSLSKDIFAFQRMDASQPETDPEKYNNCNGIINRKNETLGNFEFTLRVFPHIYLNKVIVGTDDSFLIEKEYFSYDISSKEKTSLLFERILDTEICAYHFKSQPFYRTVIGIAYQHADYPEHISQTSMEDYEIGKWGAVFPNGEIAIPNDYDYLERVSAGYFKVGIGIPIIEEDAEKEQLLLKSIKWGLVSLTNEVVLQTEYDWIGYNEETGVFVTNKGGRIVWNEKEHKPEWEVLGGVNETFMPEELP
jgi:hypothetical protein